MNKQQYLDQLYTHLQKYNVNNPIRHVSEYDYLISDMLEEMTIEQVITKLGDAEVLAANIAEEFNYNLKDENQYAESIYHSGKDYSFHKKNYTPIIIKIINIAFIIFSIFYFSTAFSILFAFLGISIFASYYYFSMFGFFLLIILFILSILLSITIYMILLNFKRWLVNQIYQKGMPIKSEGDPYVQ